VIDHCPSGWSFSFRRLIHSLKTYDSTVLVYRQTKAENNYPTKLRLKIKFFWSDKNGVVGSKLSLPVRMELFFSSFDSFIENI
jgi:hypothetical protein